MLLYSQFHVVLTAVGLAVGMGAALGISLSVDVLMGVGLGAWAAYVGERLAVGAPEDAQVHPARAAWFAQHRRGLWAGLGLAGVALAAVLIRLPAQVVPVVAVTVLVGGGYAASAPLRAHPVGKPAVIAAAWVLGGVLLPLAAVPEGLGLAAGLYALARGASVAANVVLCDWPDRAGDARAGRQTLAVIGGAAGVRRAAGGLLLVALALDIAVLYLVPGAPGRALGLIGPVGLLAACVRLPRGGEGERVVLDLLVGAGGLAVLG